MLRARCWLILVLLFTVGATSSFAQEDAAANRKEAVQLKTLNGHFPFQVPDDRAAWEERSQLLRERVLVATGLWPMPEKTPLRPVLHGKIERDGFTVEKVYFQSMPGHYVTGMLFRPAPENKIGVVNGRRPAILSPHGHGGRTMRLDDDALAKQLKSGGEIFEQSGRFPKLARCAHLARMGCVTLIFDMLGYADSQQIDRTTAHRHAKPRPEESDRDQPCLYSIDADLNLHSVMGLQTWNAIRCLDFLEGLPEVDPDRLGVTGGSGGGTQTILLGAIDPRVVVGFPNGMVSTSMQGGCYCENCNYLRIGTGNVELAALFAPKPQGMTAAKDWTRDMLTDGYPELKQLYRMLGVEDQVMCGDVLRFPHNYNYVTRSMMYPWMAKHLGLPEETPVVEQDFRPFTEQEMKVWNEEHPAPTETGVPHEQSLLAWWKEQSDRKIQSWIPEGDDQDSAVQQFGRYHRRLGAAWRVLFDRTLPELDELVVNQLNEDSIGAEVMSYEVEHPAWGTRVRFDVSIDGEGADAGDGPPSRFTIHPTTALVSEGSKARAAVTDGGRQVVVRLTPAEDLNGRPGQPLVDDKRSYSGYTFGYNRPLVARRFEQLMCAIAFLRHTESDAFLEIVADRETCVSSSAAAVVAGAAVNDLRVDTGGFRLAQVTAYSDPEFLPGAVKYLDLPGLLSLRAPNALELGGESAEGAELLERVYGAADASNELRLR